MPRATFKDPFARTSPPLHAVVVIPARYHSSRLPGKPLAEIAGRPMIEHVCRRAAEAPGVDAVVVATDDERIAAAVAQFGGIVRMTAETHRTGLDRVAEVAAALACEIVVNVQGDEPLIDPRAIAQAIAPVERDPTIPLATLRHRITDPAELASPHVVKVVVDLDDHALYFSRSAIPWIELAEAGAHDRPGGGPHDIDRGSAAVGTRDSATIGTAGFSRPIYKHIGLYAYRRSVVSELAALPQTPLELAESLEQLRALEHGYRIRAVETHYDSIGVDTPEDLERVRRQLTVDTHA